MSDLSGALELETKSFGALDIKDAEQGEVTAIVATLGVVDKDGDVLLPGSFPPSASVKMSGYNHDIVLDGAAPVGKGTITVQGDKAVFQGRFFMTTERGREAFHLVKELGAESDWSLGYPRQVKTLEMTGEWRAKGARRLIAGIQPMEASPVFRGAGIGTGTLAAKGASAPPMAGTRDLPPEVPLDQRPPLEVDKFAFSVLYFGWKRGSPDDPGTEPGMIRWFTPCDNRVAQYDEQTDTIYLSTELAEPGNEAELIKSLGHERYHAKQYRAGWLFTEGAPDGAGERLLEAWTAHAAELEAKAAAAARPIVRHFPGSSFEAAFDPHADLNWESRRKQARRAEYSFERQDSVSVGLKYNLHERIASTVGEMNYRRLEEVSRDLWRLLVLLNNGNTTSYQDAGWRERAAAVYSGDVGRNAGGPLSPELGVQAAVNTGIADLWTRFAQVQSLEVALGDQLPLFRAAHGAMAAPSSQQILQLMPLRPARQQFIGSTSS